ncbi:DUF2490 domain-containing protein [Mucilaginibacter sp. HMF5004]|uniref:DUF2490 domain-containing protein n=1 Tax=Mucilaginibacter rivuli TaxID=2857527 RepID=UPI001C6032D7|nr:DUF2490 domain-containing protein [Mucilaginibacter rivuli]MBW4889257.1 DUF2490 domain-containing protein [Mucilaginibacter rivuli]
MKRFLSFIIFLLTVSSGFAQNKQITYSDQAWLGYYPQIRLAKHWGIWTDYELQQKFPVVDNSQLTFRIGGTYYINNDTKLTAGYTYIDVAPAAGHQHIYQPENAGWQQLQWYTYYKKKKLMQWIRLEERFKRNILDDYTLANNSTFTWRARYDIFYQLPLSKKGIVPGQFSAAIGDELYINFGENIVNNYFDQNRIFLGLSYQVNKHDNLVFGYMNEFQQQPSGNQYKELNVWRVSYFQTVYLWKEKKVVTPE